MSRRCAPPSAVELVNARSRKPADPVAPPNEQATCPLECVYLAVMTRDLTDRDWARSRIGAPRLTAGPELRKVEASPWR